MDKIPAANKNPDGLYGANYGGFMTIGYDAKKVAEMLESENPEVDLVIDRYSSGTMPDERDVLKAVGAAGGQAVKVFQKITDPRLGAAQATEKDYMNTTLVCFLHSRCSVSLWISVRKTMNVL